MNEPDAVLPDRPDRPERPEPKRQAIALRYRDDHDHAPKVTAKGSGTIADRIIALAQEHGIPLHEDQDLVRLLGVLEIDAEIPPALYRALAEVLAHVYRANQRAAAR